MIMSDKMTVAELVSLTMATLLGFGILTNLDLGDIGPVKMILILITPILCVGLLCEHFRRSGNDDLEEPLKKEVATEPDELLEDEMLIHFDDYDDEDLDEDEGI